MRVNIEGQQPFVVKKGFLVQAAPRLAYSMETVGNEPVLRFEARPAGEMPSYPIDETPTPVKDTNLGHFHENMMELWIVPEGQVDILIEGEPLIPGAVGDVIQAPNERWHCATSRAPGMAARLAITRRHKVGQVHYYRPDAQGGENW
jgi:hypothetical protein